MAKVVVTMPDDLLQEVDSAARETSANNEEEWTHSGCICGPPV